MTLAQKIAELEAAYATETDRRRKEILAYKIVDVQNQQFIRVYRGKPSYWWQNNLDSRTFHGFTPRLKAVLAQARLT